jgi:hypothetical protein
MNGGGTTLHSRVTWRGTINYEPAAEIASADSFLVGHVYVQMTRDPENENQRRGQQPKPFKFKLRLPFPM